MDPDSLFFTFFYRTFMKQLKVQQQSIIPEYSWCALLLLVGPKNRSGCAWLRTSLFPWCSTKRFGAVQCALLGLPRQQQASAESRGPATPVHDNAFLPAKPTCIHDRLWLFIRLFIKFSPAWSGNLAPNCIAVPLTFQQKTRCLTEPCLLKHIPNDPLWQLL